MEKQKDNIIYENERQIEKGILIVYSLYTVAMMVVSIILKWHFWIEPMIFMGMFLCWVLFLKKYKTYHYRAFVIAAMALMNFILYGMNAESFFGILSTMGALVILLAIFNIKEIIYLAAGSSVFLLLYHGVILQTIHIPADARAASQMFLQTISIFTIECVTYYLVKTQISTNQKLMDTIEDLKQAEKSKDDFLANVSHEIRTPINVISGISEMVLTETLADNVRGDVQDIQLAGRNLLGIVSDILDFSELQSGKIQLVKEEYNITSTINDVINMAEAKLDGKNIQIITNCDAHIPSGLLGDEPKIRRVMMNIIDNAVKFTKEGCIVFTIGARRESYGINLQITVKDTGIGMEEENLEKIYRNFNQVDAKKNRKQSGLGLGLAITQALVQKMGGFISVQSTYGIGTEVRVVIPQEVMEETPVISVENPKKIHMLCYINMEKYILPALRTAYENNLRHIVEHLGISSQYCRNLAELKRRVEKEKCSHILVSWEEYNEEKNYFDNLAESVNLILILEHGEEIKVSDSISCIYKPFYALSVATVLNGAAVHQNYYGIHNQHQRFIAPDAKILVVDDNLMNLKVAEGLLRPYQVKVFTAESGKEALSKLLSMDFDFIFMDHMMPEMDGVETLHRIRQNSGAYYHNLPVIALTANAIGGAREMFLEEGFQDFVAKPIEPTALERVLRKYIPMNKIKRAIEPEKTQPQEPHEKISLDGIDVDLGISYCGGTLSDYLDIAKVYYETGEKNTEQLQRYYEQRDWKNYEVIVHAVKSTSYGIGAQKLADEAKELEYAGKNRDAEYIRNHHGQMMEEYQRVLRVLEENLDFNTEQPEQNIPLIEISKEELSVKLNQLANQLETFEKKEVEQILNDLSKYYYSEYSLPDLIREIQECIEEFDFMKAAEKLAQAGK
ncbi:MAG: ATP-binding protein [Lachnospiraceae bacterium]|nr:ATP-binding protein [Lachnospiraceae bacterium]MDD3615803.1 ATP-binding protein [Lachnospiraceae bacterium]